MSDLPVGTQVEQKAAKEERKQASSFTPVAFGPTTELTRSLYTREREMHCPVSRIPRPQPRIASVAVGFPS